MDYILRKAQIINARSLATGNLFRCRILPDMVDITETNLLPLYPNFFKDTNYAYQPNDIVWVTGTEDFTVGFILGYAQPPIGEEISSIIQLINEAEKEASMVTSGVNEISIIRVTNNCLNFVNNVNGQTGTVNSSGYVSLVSSAGDIWVRNPNFKVRIDSKGEISLQGKKLSTEFSKVDEVYTERTEDGTTKKIELDANYKIITGGNYQESVGGNYYEHVAQNKDELVGKKKTESIGLGEDKKIVAGGSNNLILAGDYTLTVGAGGINLISGVGKVSIVGGLAISITSPVAIDIKAPLIKFPMGGVAPNPASYSGMGGPFCAIPICPLTGVPHQGNTLTGPGV